MALVTCDPFQNFDQMRQDMDQMFHHLAGSAPRCEARKLWAPRVDIREDGDNITVTADLPGMKQEAIKINVEEGVLSLSGTRTEENKETDKKHHTHRRERVHGAFQRTFQLPDYTDVEKIAAHYENGVLTLTVPKQERVKPRQIEVKVTA